MELEGKLNRAREVIREVLASAEHPAILSSFGKDSMLLITLAREVAGENLPCIWFKPPNQKFAKQMILEQDMEVWSWEPADVYVLPNEDGLSLIREQSFGDQRFPVVMDIEEGTKCIGDFFPERTLQLYPHWDRIFIGYKESDYHWTLGGNGFCPADGWLLGKSRVFAPLRYLSDSEVWQAIEELNVKTDDERYKNNAADPDEVRACTQCLQEGGATLFCPKEQRTITRITWDKTESLRAFRKRFQLKDVA